MSNLVRKVELIHSSSARMLRALEIPRDSFFWKFMRKEVGLHIRRTLELFWMVIRRKE